MAFSSTESSQSGDYSRDGATDAADVEDDKKLLKEAHERQKLAEEAEFEIRRLGLEDLEFRAGKQWPSDIEQERRRDARPCLVINRIPQFVQQVVNDQRQNRPSIKVHPVDDRADPETAKILAGMIRHIEYDSNADVAYDTAFDGAVTSGFGYWRIVTEYADPYSFNQKIRIKRIRNSASVFLDPNSQEPDGSDANWGFVIENMSPEDYKAQHPDSKLANESWDGIGNTPPNWLTKDYARVAEYFYRDWSEEEIALLSDGSTILKSQLPKAPSALPPGVTLKNTRKTLVPRIRWCKLNAIEVLEKTDWLGKWIPIVPCYGTELYVDGKRILEGIVRHAKDPQRMHNYWSSAETETIALAPRAPFIAAEGQIKGHEKDWAEANRRNISVLQYKPTALGGTPVPPPQRNVFEPAVAAITQAKLYSAEDLKATTGIYDAALGNRSNETSGVAIQRRSAQAQTSNYHYTDNLTRSQRHTGRILIDLIPKVYDTPQIARIIGEEGDQKVVKINQKFLEGRQEKMFPLGFGQYDVTIDVGPSYASRRQEAVASMMELSKSIPQIGQLAPDLLVKNMDWPGAQEIADRLRKGLPPGLAEDPNGEKSPIPPEVQGQLQQQGELIKGLTEQLKHKTEQIDTKSLELESRERIEMRKLEVQLEIERARIDAKDAMALLSAEINEIKQRQGFLREDQPIYSDPRAQAPAPAQPAPAPGPEGDGVPMGAGQPPAMGPDPTGGVPPGTPMET